MIHNENTETRQSNRKHKSNRERDCECWLAAIRKISPEKKILLTKEMTAEAFYDLPILEKRRICEYYQIDPQALEQPVGLPVVYNCSGYERIEVLRQLEGKVQIYLPDFKYALTEPANRYSHAPDYPETAQAAILEMYRQVGPYRLDEAGMLQTG